MPSSDNVWPMRPLAVTGFAWFVILGTGIAQPFGAQHRPPSSFAGTLDQHPAIDYRGGALNDPVTVLRREIDAGTKTLSFDGPQGYLRSLLDALGVPVDSQVLLFSKTGIQLAFTSPETPRALYFNDRVIVGYIPGAPVIELASHDPRQGVIFQTLVQSAAIPNQFARPDRCLGCHLSANSMEVPGILVRSIFTAPDGRSMPALGSFLVDHRSPLEQRWGGWFVTGTHGSARHMGNAMITDAMKPDSAIGEGTLNRSTLIDRVDVASYPRNTSDIVALMVFDHQGHAMNLLTRLGWEARAAAADGRRDFSTGAMRDLTREVAEYLTFAGEPNLPAPVKGTSDFAKTFAASGPRDGHGRSLREMDLQTRLFKHRASYMIHSPAFDALPVDARTAVLARMRELVTDRATIEILDDTKPGWRQ